MNNIAPAARARTTETDLFREALKAFEEVTALPANVAGEYDILPGATENRVLELDGGPNFAVQVKRTLTPATLGHAVAQFGRLPKPALLVTRYVTPPMAERLKALDVAFIDTAGNAYLRLPDLLIYISGRKPQAPPPRDRRVRAFRPGGLKVIFALLCRPDLPGAPYRDVAAAAGVALGTVSQVYFDLRRLGYLRETRAKGRIIEKRHELLDKWVEAYARELRPTLQPRRYQVANPDWWKQEDLKALEMWLGGEPAAAILTKYLRPEIATVYGGAHFAELAKTVRAVKDDNGNLEFLKKFWYFELVQLDKKYALVPPLLIYADLVATADARNIETAQIIREQFLDPA